MNLENLFLFGFFVVILSCSSMLRVVSADVCGDNEEATDCEVPCHPTCKIPNRPNCTFGDCPSKCKCKDGFIREDYKGKCVPASNCVPEGVKVGHHDVTCGQNEKFVTCASPCYATCKLPIPPDCLLIWCDHGCVCNEGFIRESEGGSCIPKSECPPINKAEGDT